ncbi:MAG: undecaprenyl-diphosphate phosphatase [Peptococcaceae bacterium]|nr:undecaprenyl-diphosphate phosphatase [Peptococcaceae bacterium]
MGHYIVAVIQGIVEGLTEFLPVSSTGHLILVGSLLNFSGEKAKTFEVVIQLGAILAIVILYWQRFMTMLHLAPGKAKGLKLTHLIVASVPAAVIGFLGEGFIDKHLFSPRTVIIGLVVGGLVMIAAERIGTRIKTFNLDQISYAQAFGVGLSQCLAMWPGFSRSGATISFGLIAGMDRKTAAEFSFILAVPIMLGASGLKLIKYYKIFTINDLLFLAVGFVVSFVVAWGAVVWFLRLVQRINFTPFAVYRFIVAAVFLGFLANGIVK